MVANDIHLPFKIVLGHGDVLAVKVQVRPRF